MPSLIDSKRLTTQTVQFLEFKLPKPELATHISTIDDLVKKVEQYVDHEGLDPETTYKTIRLLMKRPELLSGVDLLLHQLQFQFKELARQLPSYGLHGHFWMFESGFEVLSVKDDSEKDDGQWGEWLTYTIKLKNCKIAFCIDNRFNENRDRDLRNV